MIVALLRPLPRAARRSLVVLPVVVALLLASAGSALASTVTTSGAYAITGTSAMLAGTYSAGSGSSGFKWHFEYGPTAALGASTPEDSSFQGSNFSDAACGFRDCAPVSGLTPRTTYYYRFVGTDSTGTFTGEIKTFTTLAPGPKQSAAYGGTSSTPQGPDGDLRECHGNGAYPSGEPRCVFPNYVLATRGEWSEPTSYHWEYGKTRAYGSSTPTVAQPAGQHFIQTLIPVSGLEAGATYFFRLVATDSTGTSYSTDPSAYPNNPNAPQFTPGQDTFTTSPACQSKGPSVTVTVVNNVATVIVDPPSAGIVTLNDGDTLTDHKILVESGAKAKYIYNLGDPPPKALHYIAGFDPRTGGICRATPTYETKNHTETVLDVILGASKPQVLAALGKSLGVSGPGAGVAAILKAGAFPAKATFPSAGTQLIQWYLVPKGAHVSAAKPTLIASGTKTLGKKGATTLKVRLTPKGKAQLKKVKRGQRLKLTAKGSFTPKGGKKTTKLKAFSIKR